MHRVLIAMTFLMVCQDVLAESTGPVYRQATAAFDSQNWPEAVKQFKYVYHSDPTSPEAEDSLFFWGESLLQLGQFDGARCRFDDYLRQWPDGPRARAAQFRAAEAFMLNQRYAEAKYRIERFTTLYPADPLQEYTTAYLAEIAVAEHNLGEAQRRFNEVIQKYPKGQLVTESRLGLARVQAERGEVEKSLATLKPIVKHRDTKNLSENHRKSSCGQRHIERKSGFRTGSKSRIYREAMVLQSSLLAKQRTARSDEKESRVEKATDLQPAKSAAPSVQAASMVTKDWQPSATAKVMWRKAQFFEKSGKLDPALTAYEDLYRKHPHTTEADKARLAAARISTQLHQYRQAKSLYDELLVRSGKEGSSLDRAVILFEAAQAQERTEGKSQGQKTEGKAIALFKRLLRDFPESQVSAGAAYRLAQYAVDAKDFEAARRYLKKSLTSNDTRIVGQSLQLTWRIAAVEQDWASTRHAAERFLALDEKKVPLGLEARARFWIAEADYRTGQFKSARLRFDALAKRIADRDLPWSGLVALRSAQSRAQLSDFSAARRSAEKASAAFPDFIDRYEFDYLIGQCAFVQGEYAVARVAFERVIQSPAARRTATSFLAQEAIASIFFVQEDYDSAATEFAKLQSDSVPSSYRAKSLHYTALCYDRLGKKQHAETLYQRLVDRYPEYQLR